MSGFVTLVRLGWIPFWFCRWVVAAVVVFGSADAAVGCGEVVVVAEVAVDADP